MDKRTLIRVALVAAASSIVLVASSAGQAPPNDTPPAAINFAAPLPSPDDMGHLRNGFQAAEDGDWENLQSARAAASDPLVKKMLEWRYASAQAAPLDFAAISQALTDLPDWPGRTTMRQRAEQAIFTSALSPAQRIGFLQQENGPISGDGRIALAQALRDSGQRSDANDMARSAWRENKLGDTARDAAISDFGPLFTEEDYAARVDMLLWRGERTDARALFAHLSAADRLLATARIALQTSQRRGLTRALAAVPASRADDPGLLYDRTRYVRRSNRPDDAMVIAERIVPTEAPPLARDDIYAERRLYVPRALRASSYRTALALVSNNGLSSGENFADGEFLAGWIELRFLRDPVSAATHFGHLAGNVSAPVSKARALYWQSEAARAQGDSANASSMLQQAAAFPFTFYGQIAASRSTHGSAMMDLPRTTTISDASRTHFESRELVRALRLMTEVGDQHDFESIAFYLDDTLTDPQEIELLSQMARERNYNRTALRSAKAGLFRGVVATSAAYPLMPLPSAISQGGGPEPALVLSIIRQESEFEVSAVSTAHARGLMQLEPSTARRTARGNGMDYDRSSLTADANYNITLGATHLGSLIEEYNGSYVLAIAAYNAGSFRVNQWMGDWGDPRQPNVDMVDWIELIPFNETRNYVQRVMENLEVYRYRLANAATPIAIEADLHRGGSWAPPATPAPSLTTGNALLPPDPAPSSPSAHN